MAQGILDKLRLIGLGNLHDLLNRVQDLNSPGMARQVVRKLEEASEKLDAEVASAKGLAAVARDELVQLRQRLATTQEHIDLFLGDDDTTNDRIAEKLAPEAMGLEESIQVKEDEVEALESTAHAMEEMAAKVRGQLTEARGKLRRLEQLAQQTQSQEDAAHALQQARDIASVSGGLSVDSTERRLRQRAAVASEKLKAGLAGVTDEAEAEVGKIRAKEYLAQRRAALQAKTGTTAEPASSS